MHLATDHRRYVSSSLGRVPAVLRSCVLDWARRRGPLLTKGPACPPSHVDWVGSNCGRPFMDATSSGTVAVLRCWLGDVDLLIRSPIQTMCGRLFEPCQAADLLSQSGRAVV